MEYERRQYLDQLVKKEIMIVSKLLLVCVDAANPIFCSLYFGNTCWNTV